MLTLTTVLCANPVCAADGVLVVRAGLDVYRLLGNGVLEDKLGKVTAIQLTHTTLTSKTK